MGIVFKLGFIVFNGGDISFFIDVEFSLGSELGIEWMF